MPFVDAEDFVPLWVVVQNVLFRDSSNEIARYDVPLHNSVFIWDHILACHSVVLFLPEDLLQHATSESDGSEKMSEVSRKSCRILRWN